MKRTAIAFALLGLSVPVVATEGIAMWGCAPEGQRRSVLYLADRGTRSYVKLGDQRVTARVTIADSQRTWSFGNTLIVLKADNVADYLEGGALKTQFKCKLMK